MKLIRYIEQRYVDSFFVTGELLLTTYQKCRQHEDAVRRDTREGKFNFHIESNGYAASVIQTSGDRSYMLCTSLIEDPALARYFGVNGCIKIIDHAAFFEEVSAVIPGIESSRLGACEYVAERAKSILTTAPIQPNGDKLLAAIASDLHGDIEKLYYEMHNDFSRRVQDHLSNEGYFAKPKAFQSEVEFRMIWTIDQPVVAGRVIRCPGAIQYCEPGVFS